MGLRCGRSIWVFSLLWTLACGGAVSGPGMDAGEAGPSNDSSTSADGWVPFSQPSGVTLPPPPPPPPGMLKVPPFVDDAGEQCVVTYNPSGAGDTSCFVRLTETCGNTSYYATCRCPQGTCGCFGPTTSVANFPGCPYCPGETLTDAGGPWGTGINPHDVFALCGFPH